MLATWLDMLAAYRGDNLLRVKGLLNVTGVDRPVVIHGVQHLFHPPATIPAWPDDDRRSRIVFITRDLGRSEEHPSELQSLMRISYAVFCLKKKSYYTYIYNLA